MAANYREFAAIDLGSNSFHMIVARIQNGAIQVLSRVKRRVRLAEGLDEQNQLSQAAMDRGLACLALFAKRLKGFSPENVKVVGTYTLRQAVNNHEFLAQAKAVFPYPIEIIAGEEEARLIYAGVSHTQPEQSRKLVVDIGGGSTEMTIGEGFTPLLANSRNMGCVSFAQAFFPQGELTPERFEQAYQQAMARIADLAEAYQQLGWQHVLGSSGTIKTVQRVLIANQYRDGLITEPRLKKLIDLCLQFNRVTDIQLKGLLEERADVLVPGLAILLALFHTFNIRSMRYSDGALREGVMYGLEQAFQTADIRQRTAKSLAKQFTLDTAHANRVEQLAMKLLAQQPKWKQPRQLSELSAILKWACQWHEVGLVINHQQLTKHSSYILSNLALPGFNREQQALLSHLVRFHAKHFKLNDLKSAHRAMGRYALQDVMSLVRLFRLAVLFCNARQATPNLAGIALQVDVTYLDLEDEQWQQGWQLRLPETFLAENPLIESELMDEVKFQRGLGWHLNVVS